MHTGQRGIILQTANCNNRSITTIFDQERGIIKAFVKNRTRHQYRHVFAGMLIEYQLTARHTYIVVSDIDILDIPIAPLCAHLAYLHQIIELIIKFSPEASREDAVFNELLIMYNEQYKEAFSNDLFIKIFICKLFAVLGIYPREAIFLQYPQIQRIVRTPTSSIYQSASLSIDQNTINVWLLDCFSTNPSADIMVPIRL